MNDWKLIIFIIFPKNFLIFFDIIKSSLKKIFILNKYTLFVFILLFSSNLFLKQIEKLKKKKNFH